MQPTCGRSEEEAPAAAGTSVALSLGYWVPGGRYLERGTIRRILFEDVLLLRILSPYKKYSPRRNQLGDFVCSRGVPRRSSKWGSPRLGPKNPPTRAISEHRNSTAEIPCHVHAPVLQRVSLNWTRNVIGKSLPLSDRSCLSLLLSVIRGMSCSREQFVGWPLS